MTHSMKNLTFTYKFSFNLLSGLGESFIWRYLDWPDFTTSHVGDFTVQVFHLQSGEEQRIKVQLGSELNFVFTTTRSKWPSPALDLILFHYELCNKHDTRKKYFSKILRQRPTSVCCTLLCILELLPLQVKY